MTIRPYSLVGIINWAGRGMNPLEQNNNYNNMNSGGKVAIVMALTALMASLSSGEQNNMVAHSDGMSFGNRKLVLMMLLSPQRNCVPLGQPCKSLIDWCCDLDWCDGYFSGTCQPCKRKGESCGVRNGSCCYGTSCTSSTFIPWGTCE